MNREKIIQLAKELNFIPFHVELDEQWKQIVADFYHAAQREAFEEAAVACDCMAYGWENNPGNNPMAGYIASSNCAAAIREMAKETQDDGYGEDNPNTTDWRKPLSTKVEVL